MRRFLVVFLVFLFSVTPAYAKDYSITKANIEVFLNKDGSADITEERTYSFIDTFSWADQYIPLQNRKLIFNSITSENTPLTYEKSLTSDKFYIKWFYNATNEKKTFHLTYTIQNALTNHQDISEFY